MRLFIDTHYFISVIKYKNVFSCQIMQLIHGFGCYPAKLSDDQTHVVSFIVHDDFKFTNKECKTLEEIFDFHKQCLIELEQKVLVQP